VHSLQTGKEKIEFSVGVKERFRREETESQMSTVPLTTGPNDFMGAHYDGIFEIIRGLRHLAFMEVSMNPSVRPILN